jgi:RecB family exonuclease
VPETVGPLAAAVRDPRVLDQPGLAGASPALAQAVTAARRVARLLVLARDTDADGTPHDVLWAVWRASGLAAEWQALSAAGGPRGSAADADLDGVVALFDAAASFSARLPAGSTRLFLDFLAGQEIPGDTLAGRAPCEGAVALLTAHRAKGLEWDVVAVAGVQEGTWPDLRQRGSLLGRDELVEAVAGRLPEDGSAAASAALASKLLGEERRLFYVAVTRARTSLLVTAVGGGDAEERPSRFLAELAGTEIEIEQAVGGEVRWLSLPGLTAELRRAAADPRRPALVRSAAAAQLAKLAAAGVRGASPAQWHQLTEPTCAGQPLPGEITLSPSQVEAFTRCGLRWLLEKAAGAGSPGTASQSGVVIHAAAALAASGAGVAELTAFIDRMWRHLDFGSPWYAAQQRERAAAMAARFLDWSRQNQRELVAVEQPLTVRSGQVVIRGQVDRLERDADGAAVVVDLKTGGSAPPDAELDRNPQLGVYQLAVLLGGFTGLGLADPGGAELVQLGRAAPRGRARVQRQQPLGADPEPGWAAELVQAVAAGMAGPRFRASPNPGCRTCPVASSCPADPRGERAAG